MEMTGELEGGLLLKLLLYAFCASVVRSEELFLDLSTGRVFEVSSTCGLFGAEEFEGSCFPGGGDSLICDASDPDKAHPPEFLSDEDDPLGPPTERTWWLSENGVEEVAISLTLEGFYFLQGVRVDYLSPLPSAAVLEVSQDFGTSFHPLRYYSENCRLDFDLPDSRVTGGDRLICTSQFSEGDESLLTYDPLSGQSADPASFLPTLSFTNVRLRLLRFGSTGPSQSNSLLGPVIDRGSFYSIYDIAVDGACICNGEVVSPIEGNDTLTCPCSPSTTPDFTCPPPSTGPLCRSCTPGYSRSPSDPNSDCAPCACNAEGTLPNTTCDPLSGQCDCRVGVEGQKCSSCPKGYVGPSLFTNTACIRCFCSGFVGGEGCVSAEGWYQAAVENRFDAEEEVNGFMSPGEIEHNPGGFLEVATAPDSQMLTLSFPPSYLGDKRTAFAQALTLTLSLPSLPPELRDPSSVVTYLELTSSVSMVDPPLVLLFEVNLDASSSELQTVQVIFAMTRSNVFRVPYFRRRRPAKERDIRIALANLRFLRLKVEFPKEATPSQRVIQLHDSSLDFATDNTSSASSALLPLQSVNYVEQCSCPTSRTGERCQTCAEHYTLDPSFGGEFAYCVRCFCNFHSTSCDPASGVCTNCTANTEGEQCETCLEGFDRAMPITFLPCDGCVPGLFAAGNGSCIPCQCNPQGSLSLICDADTGDCPCIRGVGGARCDECLINETGRGIFPNCDECDECTDQWEERIAPLQTDVLDTATLIAGLNFTADQLVADIPGLADLLQLIQDIEDTLGGSQVEMLSSDTQVTHGVVCGLLNRTRELLERGRMLEEELATSEATAGTILSNLTATMSTLSRLEQELDEIASFVDSVSIPDNSTRLLEAVQSALRRADAAERLVRVNFTSALLEIQSVLGEFNSLNVSTVEDLNIFLLALANDLQGRASQLQALVDEASARLCGSSGNGNETCDAECGGLGCGTCGGDGSSDVVGSCDGLSPRASQALNTSRRALEIANGLLFEVQTRVNTLRELLERAQDALQEAGLVEEGARELRRIADGILLGIRNLLIELERELGVARIDPDEIGTNINTTLTFQLDISLEEFFELLVNINSTIDMFFVGLNFSEVDLIDRANRALRRAQEARMLATEVVENFLRLRDRLNQLIQQLAEGNSIANSTNVLLNEASEFLDTSESLLDGSRVRLREARSSLSEVDTRLGELESRIEQNERDLETARNLTSVAEEAADEVERDGEDVGERFNNLAADARERLQESEEDLRNATDVLNRTCQLQITAQQQLLRVESLIRIEEMLMFEQQTIRDDIERVANEIEVLNSNIRIHISRNTACLDTGVLGKKKKRRKRRSVRQNQQ